MHSLGLFFFGKGFGILFSQTFVSHRFARQVTPIFFIFAASFVASSPSADSLGSKLPTSPQSTDKAGDLGSCNAKVMFFMFCNMA